MANAAFHGLGLRAAFAPAQDDQVVIPRSLASVLSPSLAGALLASGLLSAPLIACGALKIAYDLALLVSFSRVNVPLD